MDGIRKIVLSMSIKLLLAAMTGYHKKLCYHCVRYSVWMWGTLPTSITMCNVSEYEALCEMCQIIQIHIIRQQEPHTMTQMKSIHHQIRSSNCLSDSRSFHLTEKMQETFDTKLNINQST